MKYIVIAIVCVVVCNFIMPPIEHYIDKRVTKGWSRWIAKFAVALPVFCFFYYIAYLITGISF